MDSSNPQQPSSTRKKRVGWGNSSAPPSPPSAPRSGNHAFGEPDAIELTRALQILVTDTESSEPSSSKHSPPGSAPPGSGTLSPRLPPGSLPASKRPARPALRRNSSYQSRNNSDEETDGHPGTWTPRIQQGREAAAGARARADHLVTALSRRNSFAEESEDEHPKMLTVPRPAHTAAAPHSAPHQPQPPSAGHSPLAFSTGVPTSGAGAAGLGIMTANGIPAHHMSALGPAEEQSLGDLALDDPEYARIEALKETHKAAEKLVRSHSKKYFDFSRGHSGASSSGTQTPLLPDQTLDDYIPKPQKYHAGILSTILKLYGDTNNRPGTSGAGSESNTPIPSPSASRRSSFASTTRPSFSRPTSGVFGGLYAKHGGSNATLTDLMRSAGMFGTIGAGATMSEKMLEAGHANTSSRKSKKAKEQYKITLHLAGVIQRQRYIVDLCHALMLTGAPTHRLESYLLNTSKVLEIEASFLYLPGCMFISFNDPMTHTSETKLVKVSPALDLGRLKDVHEIYKRVVHDRMSVTDASVDLAAVMKRKPKFNKWILLFWYCMASLSVGPWAFGARWIDLPILFVLGGVLGVLTLFVLPRNVHLAPILEVVAAIVTSFLARMFGSLAGGSIFCFSSLAQSAIALILPGWLVLSASLELQSGQMIAGSVRMVYALIYTILLGYGITIGSVVWGAMYKNAISETTCRGGSVDWRWGILFVPIFSISLSIVNQAKFRQMPVMTIISLCGWIVNHFAGRYFGNSQISSMFGALAIGILANTYARAVHGWMKHLERLRERLASLFTRLVRKPSSKDVPDDKRRHSTGASSLDPEATPDSTPATPASETPQRPGENNNNSRNTYGYGLAAAAMMPAIFVQVPSGLAISGSLVAGVDLADQITDGTAVAASANSVTAGPAFSVLLGVIQVAIGVSMGLFLSTLIVYSVVPYRRPKRGGVFTL